MSKEGKCCENMLDEFGQPSLYCCYENGLGNVSFPTDTKGNKRTKKNKRKEIR